MVETKHPQVEVMVKMAYIDEQSAPEHDRYVFAYTVTIRNDGTTPVKLLSRRWLITDANGKTQEVQGIGVVGEQPHIKPGEGYQYTSGTVLETPVGSMEGHYTMVDDDGIEFDTPIPAFTLSMPRALH